MFTIIYKMADEYPLITNAPDVYVIAMKPREADTDLLGMLTLINLCEDDAEGVHIHLPPTLRAAGTLCYIAEDGSICPLDAERTEDGFTLATPLSHLASLSVLLQK